MTQAKKRLVKERDGFKCVNCNSREQLTIDHIVPKAEGGSDELSNLRTLCKGCNVMKADKPSAKIRFYNWLFSRKTTYELANQLKQEMITRDALILHKAKETIAEQRAEIENLIKAIKDQNASYGQRMNAMAERIRGLQSHLKVEWVEESVGSDWLETPIKFKGYRKTKKLTTK